MKIRRLFFLFLTPFLLLNACKTIKTNANPSTSTFSKSDLTPLSSTELITEEEDFQNLDQDSIDPIKLAWFYKPPKDNNLEYLAENYEIFILTKLDEEVRDKLINVYGVISPILRYIRFDAIMDPGTCLDQPYRNQVADEIGDFCRISEQHPDWFLLDRNGNRIENEEGNYFLMDPGNQEWREFWLERVQKNQEANGWQGLFLDNVEAGFSKRHRLNDLPQQYESEEEYQWAIRGFLKYIDENLAKPTQSPLYANVLSEDNPVGLLSYLPYLDGVMIEGFAVDWHDGYRNSKEWEEQLELVEKIVDDNIHVLMVSKADQIENSRQGFAFASYLLVTNGNTSFRYVLNDHTDEIERFENYSYNLGNPLGTRYLEGDVWVRRFEYGDVWVNPMTHESGITLIN